jgi:uncharacterized protein
METRAIWSAPDLEVRQINSRPVISGRVHYNTLAVMADRGKVRKEQIAPGAFDFTLSDPLAEVNLLFGHSFDKPLASRQAGSLTLKDTADFLEFVATIPEGAERASHVVDALAMLGSGLARGVSFGFRLPPKDVVPHAEELIPEPGHPSVFIRRLKHLVLYEISLVTRAAYESNEAELRALSLKPPATPHRIILP